MRLIDADVLREQLSGKEYITYTHEYGDAIPVEWVMSAIDNAPTVEYPEQIIIKCDTEEDKQKLLSALRNARVKVLVEEEERPQGKWIGANGTYYCSQCKHYAFDRQRFDFCQDCGADMRGGRQ